MLTITLPTCKRTLESYEIQNPTMNGENHLAYKSSNRIAYSAAHVVANPWCSVDPADSTTDDSIDWQTTIDYRHYLWDLGLGVAEAMDTAQRGMGLNWTQSLRLIEQALQAASKRQDDPLIVCGSGTDHLDLAQNYSLGDITKAYLKQTQAIENLGGRLVLMASRALAATARSVGDYQKVYKDVLAEVNQPVIIHWLGDMFDPQLKGYWGQASLDEAMASCLQMIQNNVDKIDGIKISLLDKQREIDMRRQLPESVKMYTGDDFNYPELIGGDKMGFSHALLGIFDAIAPLAATALQKLADGHTDEFERLLEPTVPLSRHIFKPPTRFYKSGVVFMAYLNGFQDHFTMVQGQQSARSLNYYVDLFKLADRAKLLRSPQEATERMQRFLSVNGV